MRVPALLLAAQGPELPLPGPARPLKLRAAPEHRSPLRGPVPLSPPLTALQCPAGGGREGRLTAACLFMDTGLLYWFYTPACF